MKRMLIAAAWLAVASVALAVEAPPSFLRTFGKTGTPAERMQGPMGILIDHQGRVAVADGSKNRVVMFTTLGAYAGAFDTAPMPPRGLCELPDGSLFTSSNVSPYLKRAYSPTIGTWTASGTGGPSYGLALLPSGSFLLTQTSPGGFRTCSSAGVFGGLFMTDLFFATPAGVTIVDGQIYVACPGDHMVRVYDANTFAFLRQWGGFGAGAGSFNAPYGVHVNGDAVYVADTQNHRVQKFTRDGVYLTQWGTPGTGPGQFNQPAGVAVDGNGDVYVTDFGNNRVQVFGYLPVPAQTTTWGRVKVLWK